MLLLFAMSSAIGQLKLDNGCMIFSSNRPQIYWVLQDLMRTFLMSNFEENTALLCPGTSCSRGIFKLAVAHLNSKSSGKIYAWDTKVLDSS